MKFLCLVILPFCRLLFYQGHYNGIYHHFSITLVTVLFHHLLLYNEMLIEVFALLGCYTVLIGSFFALLGCYTVLIGS